MANSNIKFFAVALFALLACKTTLAGDDTLLASLPKIFTVWTNVTSCTSQSQSDTDPDSARDGCLTGLAEIQAGNGSSIEINWRGANTTAPQTQTEAVSAALGKTTKIMLKACFSKLSTKDRKWRKEKDEVGNDKQCFKELIESRPWPTADQTPAQIDDFVWTVGDSIGRATYFFRVFAYDADGNTIGYGDSRELLEQPFMHNEVEISAADGGSGIGYWKVKGYDGLTSGVITGVVIMSILSWALLITYFVYEHFIAKDD